PAEAGRHPEARADRRPSRRGGGGAEPRPRRKGSVYRRLPPPRRRVRVIPGPLPGAPARGRALRALRPNGRQDARRRPGNLRLRALPAAPAGTPSPSLALPLPPLVANGDRGEPDDEGDGGEEDRKRADPVAGVGEYEHPPSIPGLVHGLPWQLGS